MSDWNYSNGSNLTRGEFVQWGQRIDATLKLMDERLLHIEEKLERPRRMFMGAVGATLGRIAVLGLGAAAVYAAGRYGVPVFF